MHKFAPIYHLKPLVATLLILLMSPVPVLAQNLDSTTYTLIAPSVGTPISGISDSTTYSQLIDSRALDAFTSTSTTYKIAGGTDKFIEANVPSVLCFETSTDSGTTSCTGVPGSDGMRGVCSSPGCYDRAKIEINDQGNPTDARYAVQISTASDFSSNVFYIDGTTRTLKTSLAIGDFIPKCEWEGTTSSGVCVSPNTTWQKYDILGLKPNTTYYVRASALRGSSTNASYTQSDWGPSTNATTQVPTISINADIGPSSGSTSSAPYIVNMGILSPLGVVTSTDYIIFRLTSNAISGVQTLVSGANGGIKLNTGSDLITATNGDLTSVSKGYGLRNDSTTNSSLDNTTLGTINVSASPSDFTDAGATHKVGAPTLAAVKLFDSNNLPIYTGVSAYRVKAKADTVLQSGDYSETITFIVSQT